LSSSATGSAAWSSPICSPGRHGAGASKSASSSSASRRSTPINPAFCSYPSRSDLIDEAGLGDGLGFGITDKHTLKSRVAERVFLVGDNTNVPTSKAGSVAHFQGEVVVHNLLREIAGNEAEPLADGQTNCFIETGFGKATLIDFNYDIQPVPGRFPLPGIGPLSLLKETRINHLGKLAFRAMYWNLLLPGRHIPLVGSRMSTAGKHLEVLEKYA
jgi:sulfide:quinone oxidoreductase